MTIGELTSYFSDQELFPNPDQEVRFTFSPTGLSLDNETKIEMYKSIVPEHGAAIVAFRSETTHKYRFRLTIEATPVIEAPTLEDAQKKALELMRHRAVVDICTGDSDENFVAREPCCLGEETKE